MDVEGGWTRGCVCVLNAKLRFLNIRHSLPLDLYLIERLSLGLKIWINLNINVIQLSYGDLDNLLTVFRLCVDEISLLK